jgi:Leucine-rich repeat (LRR) protein
MKKIYFLLLVFCFFNGLSAQVINFPDANFKAKLLAASPQGNGIAFDINERAVKIDDNNDGEIQITEALKVYKLVIYNSEISNLSGIEFFTNLYSLSCFGNNLISLDQSALTNLTFLDCAYNKFSSLDVSFLIKLEYLNCSGNQLTSLDVSKLTKLNSLFTNNNQLSNLEVSTLTNLEWLECDGNLFTNIDLSGLINLWALNCSNNSLTSLELSKLTKLKQVFCDHNLLTNLDISELNNLTALFCGSNKITNLNIKSNLDLVFLWCDNNQLTTIDFPNSSKITILYCGQNPIEKIDFSQVLDLESLWIGYSSIQSLDLSNSIKLQSFNISNCNNLETINLKNGSTEDLNYFEENYSDYFKTDCSNFSNCPKLKYICGDEGELESISQKISGYNYVNCLVGGYCSFDQGGINFTIQGNNRIDSNKNGCDVSDLPASNIKFTISDGTETGTIITNESDNYSIKVKEGTYTITPIIENPSYFTVSPTSVNITFPTDASPFIQDFCMTPVASHKDLEITLIPLEAARPGFDSKYKLVYKNKGNVTQSGTVNLAFDDTVLDIVISSPIVSSQNINNLSWNFSNLKPFETREITFTLNVNSPMETPAINAGTILHYTATINSADTDEFPNDNMFTFNHTVVGSLDPNDKTCLEGDIITPSLIGEYVHYLIRFENTGNYPAQNVVVKDMIDLSKFDISTLVPTDASDSYITKISEGNKVEFIFENINLPFEDANNDGYIAFKIKTKPTLVVGDSFENTANIFFDYNFPVETNTAKTTYKTTLGVSDFDFSKYVSVYPIPATTVLNISSKNNIEIQSIAIYDVLGKIVLAIPNTEKTTSVDVSNLRTGNYFVKIKSDKGSSSMKFIKN